MSTDDLAAKTPLLLKTFQTGRDINSSFLVPSVCFAALPRRPSFPRARRLNKETFTFKNGSTYELMSFGGCTRFGTPWTNSRPQTADFVLLVVRVIDRDRLVEAAEELSRSMSFIQHQTKCHDMWVLLNKQDLATGTEREDCVDDARQRLAAVTRQWADDWTVRIVHTPGLSAHTAEERRDQITLRYSGN
ncbi:uncharacterized protein LY79DRAFT_393610 [Colletotrichum navitas]|uniref:Uncharacterized protein n=1 Tax=Colletotrichum navitas TaxID=681940 RepID=A0AAD8UZS8_9PEZI|nr:uncharacterized protein LY79DRAFT_393610 [Colletotrichum navitas]KAK1573972.1 hypothetical protein LY79DRAFT_393610 [Colletotrichum navitas]